VVTDISPNSNAGNNGWGVGSGPPDPAWTSTLPNTALWTWKESGDLTVVKDNYEHITRWLQFFLSYASATDAIHPGLCYISKWCDYLTFDILFAGGKQPTLDFGLSAGKFINDGLRVAARFANLLGKQDEADPCCRFLK